MIRDYAIAGYVLRLEGRGADLAWTEAFDRFRLPEDAGREALCRIETQVPLADWKDSPDIAVLDEFPVENITCTFARHAGGYAFREEMPSGEVFLLWQEQGNSLMHSNIALSREPDPTAMRFMLWIGWGLAILPVGGVAVHSSVIVHDGRAVMFLGESGTGKSTHTRLWLKHIAGSKLLNDDSPIVRSVEGVQAVFGSPWSGKTPCYHNRHFPIAAVVRLSQAPYNQITRLGRLQALGALLPSCPPQFARDERLLDGLVAVISSVIGTVPMYHLECLPNEAAAKLVFDTVFGER
ncbi:MAG: hypothetical protein LBM63_02485 [Rikenellaceae bacterium]|jgi:hypothetical protein|nr:hypothetical protein [Rikenellaceae bacterium]